eukprot:2518687-Pleurochrysis_carterae.AAC.1
MLGGALRCSVAAHGGEGVGADERALARAHTAPPAHAAAPGRALPVMPPPLFLTPVPDPERRLGPGP